MKLLWSALIFNVLIATGIAQAAGPISGQGTWETTLKARNINGAAVSLNSAAAVFFYDTSTNLTWLANMNLNGNMTWAGAMAWADSLSIGGYSDWRLPTVAATGNADCEVGNINPNVCGYNVPGQVGSLRNEMAFLYYTTLGNLAYCAPGTGNCTTPQPGWGLTNTAYFANMQTTFYWANTAYTSVGTAWGFSPFAGNQGIAGVTGMYSGVAVRVGDVPEPTISVMLILGLGLIFKLSKLTISKPDA